MIKQSNAILFILIFSLILATSPIQASENDSTEFYIETYMTNSTEIIIADINTLEENCDVSGNTWTLRAGKYSIPSTASTISIKTKTLVVGDGVSLIIGEDISHADVLLEVDTVILKDKGILNVYGGEVKPPIGPGYASPFYGTLKTNYFIQEGGDLRSIGGNGDYAVGIMANKLFTQKSGILTANGGSEWYTHGIDALNFTQEGGVMIVNGGAEFCSYGIISYYDFIQNGGEIIITGGTGRYATGMIVYSFFQNGGILTANGGKGYASHGMGFEDGEQKGGIVNANGGEGFSSVGICYTTYFMINTKYGVVNKNNGSGEYAYGMARRR